MGRYGNGPRATRRSKLANLERQLHNNKPFTTKKVRGPYKKKQKGGIASSGVSSLGRLFGRSPFPLRLNKVLHYQEDVDLVCGTTNVLGTEMVYRLNDLFLPKTGGIKQAYGFDQMQVLYNRYKVNAVKIRLTIYDPKVADMLKVACIVLNPSESAYTLAGQTADAVGDKNNTWTAVIANSGSQKITRKMYFPVGKLANISKLQFKADPDNFTAGVGGSPATLVWMKLAACDPNGGGVTGSVRCKLDIFYYSTFYAVEVFAQST